jgi:hypothetical protein
MERETRKDYGKKKDEIIKERSISVPYSIEELEKDIEGLNG